MNFKFDDRFYVNFRELIYILKKKLEIFVTRVCFLDVPVFILDNTCRARWPEGLLCSTISLKSCNLAQILQSPKSEIVTCVMFSTHTNTSLIKPHLTELDEIHRNRPKSNYNLAKNLQSWSVTSDRHTDTHTDRDSHIFYLVPPCRSRTQ